MTEMLDIQCAHLHHRIFFILRLFSIYLLVIMFPPFFQCICSLLHINKIFEVGISEHLANKLQHMNIDLIGKVLISNRGSISSTNSKLKFGKVSCCCCNFFHNLFTVYVIRQILPLQLSWITCQIWSVQNLFRFHFCLEFFKLYV
jgi:hypothetical protein